MNEPTRTPEPLLWLNSDDDYVQTDDGLIALERSHRDSDSPAVFFSGGNPAAVPDLVAACEAALYGDSNSETVCDAALARWREGGAS